MSNEVTNSEADIEIRELRSAIELTESLARTCSSPKFMEEHKKAVRHYQNRLGELLSYTEETEDEEK